MEKDFLLKEGGVGARWGLLWEEMKRLGFLAGPMVAVTLSQFLLQVVSLIMVGRLGQLPLAGASMAICFAGVTGFSVLMGMATAQETLSGQAYGARQFEKVGTQTYTAVLCLIITCIPLSVVWMYMESLLRCVGQDPQISHEAGKFIMWLIPALFGYASLQPLIRYYQMQSLISPMLISSGTVICFHVMACWMLVFKFRFGSTGAAAAMGLSMWLNVIILGLFFKYSSMCAKTRAPISLKIFEGVKTFFAFAVPSALMICLEWWSYELLILLSGLLPNPQLETSVLSVCVNTIMTLYAIPTGLAAAGSTRISNELGAGRPQGARLSVIALVVFAAINAITTGGTLCAARSMFGHVFSEEKEVQDYVTKMAPLLCSTVMVDNIQGTLAGVARGCGWQHIGAYINLTAYYVFGIPIAATLCFWWDLRGIGLWIGILSGAMLQMVLLGVITACIKWEKQAIEARERSFKEEPCLEGEEESCLEGEQEPCLESEQESCLESEQD